MTVFVLILLSTWLYTENIWIGYGSNDLVTIYDKKQYVGVEHKFKHPEHSVIRSDIALLKLEEPLNLTEGLVEPACLPTENRAEHDGILKVRIQRSFIGSSNFFFTFKAKCLTLNSIKILGWGSVEPIEQNRRTGQDFTGRYPRYLKEGETYDITEDPEIQCGFKEEAICTRNQVDAEQDRICHGKKSPRVFLRV